VVRNLRDRAEIFAALAYAQVVVGRVEEAFRTIRAIEDPYSRANALADIAAALAAAGDVPRALLAAQAIGDPNRRADALTRAAAALAEIGKRADARVVVLAADTTALLRIANEGDRSHRLREVARVLARLGAFREAREVANRRHLRDDDRLAVYTTILQEYGRRRHGRRTESRE
jgi:hypothetical protein